MDRREYLRAVACAGLVPMAGCESAEDPIMTQRTDWQDWEIPTPGRDNGEWGAVLVDWIDGTLDTDTILSLPVDGPMTGFNRGALKLPPAEELPTGTVDESTGRQRPGL